MFYGFNFNFFKKTKQKLTQRAFHRDIASAANAPRKQPRTLGLGIKKMMLSADHFLNHIMTLMAGIRLKSIQPKMYHQGGKFNGLLFTRTVLCGGGRLFQTRLRPCAIPPYAVLALIVHALLATVHAAHFFFAKRMGRQDMSATLACSSSVWPIIIQALAECFFALVVRSPSPRTAQPSFALML